MSEPVIIVGVLKGFLSLLNFNLEEVFALLWPLKIHFGITHQFHKYSNVSYTRAGVTVVLTVS